MTHPSTRVTACRICGKEALAEVLDYGRVALADAFLDSPSAIGKEEKFPLSLCLCSSCGHLQINVIVNPELLFREYIYLTGTSDSMVQYAEKLYDSIEAMLGVAADRRRLVIEAASNDGTVLAVFQKHGWRVLGIDPARNIADIANGRGIETMAEFFNEATARAVASRWPGGDVFIARNVLAHVADLHGFVKGIGCILDREGVGVIEVPHALTMFDQLQYDQVFHEHIGFYTVESLQVLFGMHDFRVFHVDEIPHHGGSIRVHICRKGAAWKERESVDRILRNERARGLGTLEAWRGFASRVQEQRKALRRELEILKGRGQRIAAYGASGKGQAMLQFCGIDASLLDYVVDKNQWKQGKLTPGTHLPVFGPERLATHKPDVLLLSAWNLADEILRQQQAYLLQGGRVLHPLPMPRYLN